MRSNVRENLPTSRLPVRAVAGLMNPRWRIGQDLVQTQTDEKFTLTEIV